MNSEGWGMGTRWDSSKGRGGAQAADGLQNKQERLLGFVRLVKSRQWAVLPRKMVDMKVNKWLKVGLNASHGTKPEPLQGVCWRQLGVFIQIPLFLSHSPTFLFKGKFNNLLSDQNIIPL